MLQKFGAFPANQFQRPVAWKADDRKKFFQSVLMNRVEGSYVLVDIKTCISRLEISGEYDNESYKFFKQLLNSGHKYRFLMETTVCLSFGICLMTVTPSLKEGMNISLMN